METITKNTKSSARLAELETESASIIEQYLRQVVIDPNAAVIKTLRNRLKDLRAEQWQLMK